MLATSASGTIPIKCFKRIPSAVRTDEATDDHWTLTAQFRSKLFVYVHPEKEGSPGPHVLYYSTVWHDLSLAVGKISAIKN